MYRTLALALLLVAILFAERALSTESNSEEWERPMSMTEFFAGPGCHCLTENQLSAIPTEMFGPVLVDGRLSDDATRSILKTFQKGLKVYLKDKDVKKRLRYSAWTADMITEITVMGPLISTDMVEPLTLTAIETALMDGNKYSVERIQIVQIVKDGLKQIAAESSK